MLVGIGSAAIRLPNAMRDGAWLMASVSA